MTKKSLLTLVGICLLTACTSSAFAAVTLKRLGEHPFSRKPMSTEADLRQMVEKHNTDVKKGFDKAGNPELYAEFYAQFPTTKVEMVEVAPGEQFSWMIFRKSGTNQIKAVKDVTWGGESAFSAFRFYLDVAGQRYEFIVPLACGNLALKSIAPVQEPVAVNQPPVCSMTLSANEIKCGQVVTVDASGSSDPDGSIAEVVFQVLDASNQVVAEKRDNEAPFVQDLPIGCESSQYTVKAVVIDNAGAQSSPSDCSQTVMVAKSKGAFVADVGLAHQFDPATYLFGRVGYEYPLAEKLYVLGMIGGFAVLDEEENELDPEDIDSAFTVDALLNYYFNEKMFAGGGLGFWSGHDGEVDLILNTGYLVYENPEVMKMSVFLEGRCEADELVSSRATRLGAGLRFHF